MQCRAAGASSEERQPSTTSDSSLDTDADGYTNAEEYQFGKNPRFKEDTDGYGMPDGWEYHNGLNLLSAVTSKCTTCGHFKVHHL